MGFSALQTLEMMKVTRMVEGGRGSERISGEIANGDRRELSEKEARLGKGSAWGAERDHGFKVSSPESRVWIFSFLL